MSNENMAWFWAILSGASMIVPSSSHCAAVYAGLMCVLSCEDDLRSGEGWAAGGGGVRLESKFDIRDIVTIDGNMMMRGVVVAIRWSRDDHPHYEVSYFMEGRPEFVYLDEWRLGKFE